MSATVKRESRPWLILKTALTIGGVLALGVVAPVGTAGLARILFEKYKDGNRFARNRLLRDVRSLQKRKLVDYRERQDGAVEVTLTARGKRFMLKYRIDDIALNMTNRWDRRWRMVMFDIPHRYKKARDAFRRKLNQLGFYAVQKSVFITPYPCEQEIEFIATILDIRQYILLMPLGRFEGERKLMQYFDLSYKQLT